MELDEPLSEQPPFLLFTKWTHQKTLRSLEVSLLKKKILLCSAWTPPASNGNYFLLHFLKLYLEKSLVLCFVKKMIKMKFCENIFG